MVRQYKIHTNLDGTDDKVWDVTNGKVRFYQPSNLGLQSTNNIWQTNGVGVMGTRSITQPQIEFKLETFGESLEENYQLMKDFVNDILSKKFVTLEYQTEIFQVYADLALADVTKTEGYGKNGTFSEKITFDIITKWYTYENLTFEKIQNGKVIAGKSKIYGGTAPGNYKYVEGISYTYYGETNIDRLIRWDIKDEIFSFVGVLYPHQPKAPAGIRFLDDNGNEYTAIVFKTEQVQDYILINTDVNDEIYQGWNGTTSLNLFPVMDFERYRTRIIKHGQMELINLTKAEFKIKRKADFV
ncbi:distal tail protein [Lactococcus phage 936 group phage PhiC0139]|uniref:Distal tail protein n=1 Tax=Lactococcus phage 936 group phage PhiC0139 TaxID=1636574 RepID=A0A126HA65_9CAUD|nr:distal tail protein [Lactococcus phage 936 group phage PhiC0139]